MPLYEYKCQECGVQTEELQRFSDPPLTTCRACGGELKKLLSAPAFHLKGSGWYATDYGAKKDAGAGPGAKEAGGDSSDAAPKKETSSDSTSSPKAKADSKAKS